MALSYPLTFPSNNVAASIQFRAVSTVGESRSPFTGESQVYVHAGEWFEADVQLPKMQRAAAEDWIAGFLLALNGVQGTFLMGDPSSIAPRGSWAGAPKVLGAHIAGVKTIAMDGFTSGATVKNGDWIQSGVTKRLHKAVKDATADGAGLLTLEVWPRTRDALADNDVFVTSSPVGTWRLASNERNWSVERARIYGIQFACREAL